MIVMPLQFNSKMNGTHWVTSLVFFLCTMDKRMALEGKCMMSPAPTDLALRNSVCSLFSLCHSLNRPSVWASYQELELNPGPPCQTLCLLCCRCKKPPVERPSARWGSINASAPFVLQSDRWKKPLSAPRHQQQIALLQWLHDGGAEDVGVGGGHTSALHPRGESLWGGRWWRGGEGCGIRR